MFPQIASFNLANCQATPGHLSPAQPHFPQHTDKKGKSGEPTSHFVISTSFSRVTDFGRSMGKPMTRDQTKLAVQPIARETEKTTV